MAKIIIEMSDNDYQELLNGQMSADAMRKIIQEGLMLSNSITNMDLLKVVYPDPSVIEIEEEYPSGALKLSDEFLHAPYEAVKREDPEECL